MVDVVQLMDKLVKPVEMVETGQVREEIQAIVEMVVVQVEQFLVQITQ